MKTGEAIALVFLVVIGGAAVFLALKAKGAAPAAPQKPGFTATVGSTAKSITSSLPSPVRNAANTVIDTSHSTWEKVGSKVGTAGEVAARAALFPVTGVLSLF
jgi:hypothetical protein